MNDALRAATGLGVEEANAAWLKVVPAASWWYRWATNTPLWWSVAACFLALAAPSDFPIHLRCISRTPAGQSRPSRSFNKRSA